MILCGLESSDWWVFVLVAASLNISFYYIGKHQGRRR